MDRRKVGILLLCGAAVCLLTAMTLARRGSGTETEGSPDPGLTAEVPDAEKEMLPVSKSEAYAAADGGSRTDSYWDSCEKDLLSQEKEDEVTAEDLLAEMEPSRPEPAAPRVNPYRETHEQREERHRQRREEAMDMAEEMAGGREDSAGDTPEPESDEAPEGRDAVVKRSSVISSLDDGWTSDGISSLDTGDEVFQEDDSRPFRCMFARDSKVRNGQRVSVILLEDIIVDGTLVPRNTHIMAGCHIGQRLEMDISNIEIGGRIITLGYEAYDIDGSRGIYCPDVGNAGRQARTRGRNAVGSRLSGMVGGIAREVVSTGVSLMQSRDGEMTVTVPAGYTFFIIRKKDR